MVGTANRTGWRYASGQFHIPFGILGRRAKPRASVAAHIVMSLQLSLRRSNDENALSRHFQHLVIPWPGKLLFTPRAKPFLREDQIFLAVENLRRGVVVAGERFLQSVRSVAARRRHPSTLSYGPCGWKDGAEDVH